MGLPAHNQIKFTSQQGRRMPTTEQSITTSSSSIDISRPSRAQQETRRSVSFNPRARIRSISPVGSYSSEERDAYWYSQNDLALIQEDMAQTIMLMETNQPNDESTQCFRGLERRTRTALEAKKNERIELLEAVAREYYMQKQYGQDECALAEMYRQRCAQDTESAQLMGIVDADQAYAILLQDIVDVLMQPDEEEDDFNGSRRWYEQSLQSILYESDNDLTDDGDYLALSSSAASLTKEDLVKESHHRQQRRLSCPPRVLEGSFARAAAA